ncbi:signal peptidase II [Marvinbryantia formatexigens DSM 14469]|uniref:Lipoprotein signal peptidase n=1 Tax=Marvinbryantia formatexigens DSM 14469 TaxID=478749 RepID=C6LCA1_9FIRM|nr:signal peptidase II [Marvinbryantia formatexigens]EET61565.1 signal peptidase II [Marvinbryantia formatexigens DSM 14469]UWO24603.1 signal peptidase II [Marvinbryantia formatexigens DSM 14469]SDF15167.1 signal peptidase II [Marvinbryantia formatexigens]
MEKHPAGKKKAVFSAAVLSAALLAADQLTKYLAVRYLKGAEDIILIPGVFQLSYLENTGAAWGMFGGMQWVFLLLTALIIAGVCYLWHKVPFERKYRAFRILSAIFLAGAVGNAIDRLFRGYVVDFFYFSLINFPVFNVADCYVTVSLVLLLIIYRNEDFSWMNKKS